MVAEGFVLQKLQHSRGQGLGDAVDLIQKEDALPLSRPVHGLVHGADDLAHGVFRHGKMPPAVVPLCDFRQAHGALAGVVRHGVGHQGNLLLLGHLLHNGGLSHAGRPHEQQRPLPDRWEAILSLPVLLQIRPQGIADLFLCLLDVHHSLLIPIPASLPIWAPVPGASGVLPGQRPSRSPAYGDSSRPRP